MKKITQVLIVSFLIIVLIFLVVQFGGFLGKEEEEDEKMNFKKEIELPEPKKESEISVEEAILGRRSRRNYRDEPLTLEEVSQLLWAAQGITGGGGFKRAAPSAGATYPLEVFLVVGKVENLNPGVYRYDPQKHSLIGVREGDVREKLAMAALGQHVIADASVDIVFTAIYERTTGRYGERGIKYVHMEVGHAAENVYLECESLKLGTVVVGAFHDEEVKDILGLDEEEPLYIMPVGRI